MEMQTINLGYGKAVLSSSTIALSAFRVRNGFQRDSAAISGRRQYNSEVRREVSPHPQINGYLYSNTVGHENGTIIMLNSIMSRGGRAVSAGAVLLRLRARAATIQVNAVLPVGRDNFIGEHFCMFSGCADILSPDEARDHGVVVPDSWIDMHFDADRIAERFDVLILQDEVEPAREIIHVPDGDGGTITAHVAPAPTRRIRIRR